MRGVLAVGVLAALAAGCGGKRQDADEPSGSFRVEIVSASFPARQHVAEPVALRLRVRNLDSRTLDSVAVTVETAPARRGDAPIAFGQHESDARLADSGKPIWVLDEGPQRGDTAMVNTWSAGALRPGATREMVWRLVAAKAGTYTVAYSVSPGLNGKARARGARTRGSFRVTILDTPVPARVGPNGEVIRGDGAGGR